VSPNRLDPYPLSFLRIFNAFLPGIWFFQDPSADQDSHFLLKSERFYFPYNRLDPVSRRVPYDLFRAIFEGVGSPRPVLRHPLFFFRVFPHATFFSRFFRFVRPPSVLTKAQLLFSCPPLFPLVLAGLHCSFEPEKSFFGMPFRTRGQLKGTPATPVPMSEL